MTRPDPSSPLVHAGRRRNILTPRVQAGRLIETFLVSAVVCVLAIRAFLASAGYPQLGGGGLHIAHMLWGGLGMLAALLIVFTLLDAWAAPMAALLGGLGFGAFIDEIGKFVTADNDYFFRPAIAMIYVSFILLFLLSRALANRVKPSPAAYLANALDVAKEAAIRQLNAEELQRARALLQQADQKDPLAIALKDYFDAAGSVPRRRRRFVRLVSRLHGLYARLIRQAWFSTALVLLFVAASVVALLESMIAIPGVTVIVLTALFLLGGVFGAVRIAARLRADPVKRLVLTVSTAITGVVASVVLWSLEPRLAFPSLGFSDWCQLLSTVAIGVLSIIGVWSLRRSRLGAYRWFERAILMSIFFAQVFAFYRDQLSALIGLAASLLIWGVLRYMIYEEEAQIAGADAAGVQSRMTQTDAVPG